MTAVPSRGRISPMRTQTIIVMLLFSRTPAGRQPSYRAMDLQRHKEPPQVHRRTSEDMEQLNVSKLRHSGTLIARVTYWHLYSWRTAAGSTESIVRFGRRMDFLRWTASSCGNSHTLFRISTTRQEQQERSGRPVYPCRTSAQHRQTLHSSTRSGRPTHKQARAI